VSVTASRGEVRIADPSFSCSAGTTSLCSLGSFARGAERTLVVLGTPGGVGNLTYTARIAWDGEPDVDPASDETTASAAVAPCDVLGTWASDRLAGTPHRDRICGRPGDDRIDGAAGNDYIDAGSGADTVIGGKGRDTILGGGGGDVILVRDGERDVVDCGTEQDTAVADRLDVLRHCEHVTRASARH
jgi:Ca2+-binding RTX toxin-like protein